MAELRGVVEEGEEGVRVDRYVSTIKGGFTRSQLHQSDPTYCVNGKTVKPSHRVCAGDIVTASYTPPSAAGITPEELPLDILYEDESVIVVNKPTGMVVHPAHGNPSGTLMQGLMYYISSLREKFAESSFRERPGIVHRLDKDTSGVIIAAKNPEALEYLALQFRQRTAKKIYLAVVKGTPRSRRGIVEGNIRRDPAHRKRFVLSASYGKSSRSYYRVVRELGEYALVELRPVTGRTHQLRVHMQHIGNPVLGDPVYGRNDPNHSDLPLMLHAYRLSITTPDGVGHTFKAPLPERFRNFLARTASKR